MCRQTVISALVELCKQASTTKELNWDWLLVLPLYHFMKGNHKQIKDDESIANQLDLKKLKNKLPPGYVH